MKKIKKILMVVIIMMIDSHALSMPIADCRHFRWKEALKCHQWNTYIYPAETQVNNIVRIARKLERIRDILGVPLHITSWYRPAHYNKKIGGSPNSYHITGAAVDFVPIHGMTVSEAKELIFPHLEELGIRMEKHSGGWIHIDLGMPGKSGRYFKP